MYTKHTGLFLTPVLVAGLSGCDFSSSLQKCADQERGKPHAIHITVSPGAPPKVDREKVSVCPEDFVVWSGPRDFEIIFKNDRTPTDKDRIRTQNGIANARITKRHEKGGDNYFAYGIKVPNYPALDPGIIIKD